MRNNHSVNSLQEARRRLDRLLAQIDAVASPSRLQHPGSTWASLNQAPAIQWDWPGWLPHGFLTILASEPGVGKSFLALRIAASYIDGRPWPDATPFTVAPGQTLWAETESGQRMHRQRLLALGLDPGHLAGPLDHPLHNVHLEDPEHVRALFSNANRDDVRLVVLDSLTGHQGLDLYARPIVNAVPGFAHLATLLPKPILITHHLQRPPTLDRLGRLDLGNLLGSPILARVARVVWLLDSPDPADPGHLRLSMVKNNLAALAAPIGLRIDAHGPHFGPPPQPSAAQSEEDRAVALLMDLLANGPLPANQVTAKAQAAGISGPTLKRAKSRLRVKSNKHPNQWTWQLPID